MPPRKQSTSSRTDPGIRDQAQFTAPSPLSTAMTGHACDGFRLCGVELDRASEGRMRKARGESLEGSHLMRTVHLWKTAMVVGTVGLLLSTGFAYAGGGKVRKTKGNENGSTPRTGTESISTTSEQSAAGTQQRDRAGTAKRYRTCSQAQTRTRTQTRSRTRTCDQIREQKRARARDASRGGTCEPAQDGTCDPAQDRTCDPTQNGSCNAE